MTRRASTIIALIVFTAVYIAAGKLGLSMAFLNASVSPIWPPTGLALAAMLLFGYRLWPAVLVGAFIVNLTTAGTIATSVVIAAGNTSEAVVGAMLVRRFAGGTAAFDTARNIFRFVIFAAIPCTMLCATIGVTCLAVGHFVRWDLYGPVWMTWWTGDLVGGLTFAPLIVIWATGPRYKMNLAQLWEALFLAIVLVAVGNAIFIRWHLHYGRADALAYLAVPPLIWAAFRFQQRGAITAAFVLSAMAVRGTLRGAGPFATGDANESLLLLQIFMGINVLMALILAAVVSERTREHAERKQALQREQNARADAEQASRAKDQFLAVLSHELRTPLTPVLLATTLLENSVELPPELSKYAQMIRRNVELEARLIDDLLDLTRVTRGKLQLNFSTVDVHEVLHRAIEICCAERGGDLMLELAAARHHVRGDPARLQQIFWNLISNAVKFTPPGRSIMVRSKNSAEAGAGDPSAIEIEVSDSGIGIEPEILPRLFNAFEQGDAMRTRTFGGLGLGLAITKALVEAHAGKVTAQSAGRETGATFTVQLPVTADIAPQMPHLGLSPLPPKPAHAQVRILLVEDHKETLEVLAKLLTRLGHEITTASTIESALNASRNKQFDLVISDLGLPDGLGYELMRSLRAKNHVRGIALSGYGMSEDIHLSQSAGFAEHLVKPVDLNDLQAAIARVLAVHQ